MTDDYNAVETVHEALQDVVNNLTPGSLVVGWSVIMEYINPEDSDTHTSGRVLVAGHQMLSTSIGQAVMLSKYQKSKLEAS